MIPLGLITHAVAASVAALAAAYAAWVWQANSYGHQIADMQRTQALAALRAAETSARQTLEMQHAKDTALAAAAQRTAALARTAAAVRTERDGLRDQLATAARQLPHAACPAVRDYASTAADLLGECAGQLESVATAADGHASDTLTLLTAWPTTRPATPPAATPEPTTEGATE